jgi:ankyrin repeat protein
LTCEGVADAVSRGIPVSARLHDRGWTALHYAVLHRRLWLVEALLEAGADVNVKGERGRTPVYCATLSTGYILRLLIDSGGSVNEPDNDGITPLIAIVRRRCPDRGDVEDRLRALLACSDLDLNLKHEGKVAEQWATERGHADYAMLIANEQTRRRWVGLRSVWVAATATSASCCERAESAGGEVQYI